MKRTLIFAAIAATLTFLAFGPAYAGAAKPAANSAKVVGVVKAHGDSATVQVRYRCTSGQVVWVSAKQSDSGAKEAAVASEGYGYGSTEGTFQHSHRNSFTCDGKNHTSKFTVDKLEGGRGQLRKGYAWVQFCLTANESLVISEAGWQKVR